ncbi:putative 2OG Fe(II) oxygenase superfamily [Trypanosoma vivax]|uniref:Alpha-ketoglutarate-dependent dioxygenase AlkB-like domain-containing protein n=1 Tax=Trypanosoma vivax (strain Y486) TaxID=1055687 RepID=G0UD46_TRYVY|nr:putative 2OG Fe(II) oxygenase superfamily [Trypanosoma vivax]CCC53756.1 conserved hypothetical protein [Trypanosoma vivax Y486]
MRVAVVLRDGLRSYVSFRHAPRFRQAKPEEAIGVSTKRIPPDCVPAFVIPDIVNEREEQALLHMTEPWFSRLPFSEGHMDALIHHYKEFYRSYAELAGAGAEHGCCPADPHAIAALRKCHGVASEYLPGIPLDDRVHFLRLSGNGFIRAHVDDSRNSSGIVAGLSLGTARVMTLTHPEHPGQRVELMLAPRTLYVLIGTARYNWAHSTDWEADDTEHVERARGRPVMDGPPLVFDGSETTFRRGERTAVIFRGISPMELLRQRMAKKKGAS